MEKTHFAFFFKFYEYQQCNCSHNKDFSMFEWFSVLFLYDISIYLFLFEFLICNKLGI